MQALPIVVPAVAPAPSRPDAELTVIRPPPAGERARLLLAQARATSIEHLEALQQAIGEVRGLADGVVRAGDLYQPGLNDLARRISEDLLWQGKSLEALTLRQRDLAKPDGRRRAS